MQQRSSRLIIRVLRSAIKAWLRSQLTAVADLKVEIEGCDRNLLTGNIPKVCLTAEKAIYQGLHLSHINIVAHQIQVNLKQILRGKPLRLMQPIPIDLSIVLQATDLNESRSASLLRSAVVDLLQTLYSKPQQKSDQPPELEAEIQLEEIQLKKDGFILKVLRPSAESPSTATLETCLTIGQPWELLFYDLQYQVGSQPHDSDYPQTQSIHLGDQVNLQLLTLTHDALTCQAQVEVQP